MKKGSWRKPLKPLPSSSEITLKNSNQRLSPFVRGFLKRVQNAVSQYDLWSRKESFIVAVSGGPDSVCLLDVLFLLSQKYDFTLHIAHVNYRLRGKDSDLDESLVRERAKMYNIEFSVLRCRKNSKHPTEEELRDIRYRFFENVRNKQSASLIAVAHHENDQAETFLLRLLRGSGMVGLASMQPKSQGIVRPLLTVTREDILQYLSDRGLSYRIDKSNRDTTILRNRIRHELLPLLAQEYQPNIQSTLARTATLFATDYSFMEKMAALHAHTLADGMKVSVKALLAVPPAILHHLWRNLLKARTGKFPSQGIITEIMKVLTSTKNKTHQVSFQGLKIERKGDTVTLLHF